MTPQRWTVLLAVLGISGCATGTSLHPVATPASTRTIAPVRSVPSRPAVRPVVHASLPVASLPVALPAYQATVSGPLTPADVPFSWRPGCPVAPSDLREIHLSYVDFGGQPRVGVVIVNASVVPAVIGIFERLYLARFPIRQLQPIDVYHGQDRISMAHDNTSGFNCRYAVTNGPPQWSAHAYGMAIDVNTVENPYLEPGHSVQPPQGAAYVNRSDIRPGMAYWGGTLVNAFAAAGWQWGGRWASSPDYQHFSATGG